MTDRFAFYEFFCGGGMARAGLGSQWECVFANDIDPKKASSYEANWGSDVLYLSDISDVKKQNLVKNADLAWASFPCQDLSLAGMGAGLSGERSGTFWPFWNLMRDIGKEGRSPKIIVLENVCGAITSNDGKDFTAICEALSKEQYLYGALVIDAVDFIPQSRPRLFFVAVKTDEHELIASLTGDAPNPYWHPDALVKAQSALKTPIKKAWLWWNPPIPESTNISLVDLIEESPQSIKWHSREQTNRLIEMMSETNLNKLIAAKESGKKCVGMIYKRTRIENGIKLQRAEVRFDGVAGCLRTPGGGSSKQIVMIVEGKVVRSRLLSTREAARLMGLPDSYVLPTSHTDAYHLLGDGLVVPVVNFVSEMILKPILSQKNKLKKVA